MDSAPWDTSLNHSKMAQDMKMEFFKFNLTLMGVILHMMQFSLISGVAMATFSYKCVARQRSEETCIFARILA